MDVFTHTLWGATLIRKRRLLMPILLAGLLPDLLGSSIPYTMEVILKMPLAEIPYFFFQMYYFTHSLTAVFIFFVILFLFFRRYLILAIPYLSHLALDLPTHAGLYANQPFYPFSHYAFQGLIWEKHWWITALSALGLIMINSIFYLKNKWPNTRTLFKN